MQLFDSVRFSTGSPVGAAGRVRAGVLVPILLLLLTGCGTGAVDAPDGPRSVNKVAQGGERPPIEPEVVQEDVERHEEFHEMRRAACPRRVLDRHEERRRYPAIDLMHGLGYVTLTDDTSRGKYEKVIELTDAGQRDLGNDLEEEEERYVITLARREYVSGSERFDKSPKRDDLLFVSFRWFWSPLNPLGERLVPWTAYADRTELQGRATYARTAGGWTLDEVWFDSDGKDYMRGY